MRSPLPQSPWLRLVLVTAVVGGAVALVWWRGPSWGLVVDAFTVVAWRWVVLAIALNLLSVLARSLAWRTVIEQGVPEPRPAYPLVFSAFCVGLLGNAVLPGRIGEIARIAVLTRRLPRRRGLWATLAGTVVAHRVFDLVAVSLLVLYVLAATRIPPWAVTSLIVVVAAAAALLGIGVVAARRRQHATLEGLGRLRRLLTQARQGLAVMRSPLASAVAMLLQCVGWGCQLLAVYAAMRAFRIEEPLAAAGLVLVLMNVATIFPLWPGNVGLLQAAVALPLVAYGIEYAHGFAFGIGLQAIEMSVGVGVGLAFLTREGLSFAVLRRMPDEAEDEAAVSPAGRESHGRERARVPG